MQAKGDLSAMRAAMSRLRGSLSRARTRHGLVPGLCLALGLCQAITAPVPRPAADCGTCGAPPAVGVTAPLASAPTPPLQGPGVAAPVPLVLPTPSIEDSQAWANARPWPPPGWQPPPPPRRREERTVGGFFRNLDRSLSQIFR